MEFGTYLGRTVYALPALPPAMPWKQATDPGTATGITLNGNTLTWTEMPGVRRYTVYAIPATQDISTFTKDVKQLLGITYTASYAIPQAYATGYKFAVCAYDRFGNEWAPAFSAASVVLPVRAASALSINGDVLSVAAIGAKHVTVSSYTAGGALERNLYAGQGGNLSLSLSGLAAGAHIVTVNIDGTLHTIKYVK